MRPALVPTLLVVVLSDVATGAEYFVDGSPSGCGGSGCSDANAGTSEATAFATPQGCVDAMQGGDTCSIMDGTYVGAGTDRYLPRWNFCISGSASAYTTIRALPGHHPRFCKVADCVDALGEPQIGASGTCSYIRFEGLTVIGGMLAWGVPDDLDHIEIVGNDLSGGYDCDNNWSPLRLERVASAHVAGNYIHNIGDLNACGGETAGVKMFCVHDSIVEYNTIDTNGGRTISHGIDDKDTSRDNVIRFNYVRRAGDGVRYNAQSGCGDATGTQIYGNVFEGCDAGVSALVLASHGLIHHNTFVNDGVSTAFDQNGGTGVSYMAVTDNLSSAPSTYNWLIDTWSYAQIGTQQLDYNVYDAGATYRSAAYGANDTTHDTLASWRTTLQADGCTACEAHSQELACAFTPGADTPYHLSPGTACTTASSTGGEVGAYGVTDCVGATCAGGTTPGGGGAPPDDGAPGTTPGDGGAPPDDGAPGTTPGDADPPQDGSPTPSVSRACGCAAPVGAAGALWLVLALVAVGGRRIGRPRG